MADLIPVQEGGRTSYLRREAVAFIRPGDRPGTCWFFLTSGAMYHVECSAEDLRNQVEGHPTAYAKPLPTTPGMDRPYQVGEAGPTIHQG